MNLHFQISDCTHGTFLLKERPREGYDTVYTPANPSIQWIAFHGVIVAVVNEYGETVGRRLVDATEERYERNGKQRYRPVRPSQERIDTAIDELAARFGLPD